MNATSFWEDRFLQVMSGCKVFNASQSVVISSRHYMPELEILSPHGRCHSHERFGFAGPPLEVGAARQRLWRQ